MIEKKSFLVPILVLSISGLQAAHSSEMPISLAKSLPMTDSEPLQFDSLDVRKLQREDQAFQLVGRPLRYAVTRSENASEDYDSKGSWTTIGDTAVWRLKVQADQATSLSFGFDNVFLPAGASLFVYDQTGQTILGPYTDQNNNVSRSLWTAILSSDTAIIELNVPLRLRKFVSLDLSSVSQGYRSIESINNQKSGSCNIDVVCPDGDNWRDEIRSVARYTYQSGGSGFVCTGTLVNNVAQDSTPYFLTANHCVSTDQEAQSMVIYWNYETSACGGIPDGSLGQNQSGAQLISTWSPGDVTLVELNQAPDAAFNVYYAGWDNTDATFNSAVAIHHPSGDEKRISFDDDALVIANQSGMADPDGNYLMVEAWNRGTTEPGSSGSGLWNANKHIVGTLFGGIASCTVTDGYDVYGRIARHWTGGGTADSQLKAWLDPNDTGVSSLDGGVVSCVSPTASFTIGSNPAEVGQAVTFTSTVTGGSGSGYTYAWDFDGDGSTDSTLESPSHTYSASYLGNVVLSVSDSASCSISVTQAIVVEPAGGNQAPVAGVVQSAISVDEGASVSLDASNSSDGNGDTLAYSWTQTSGAGVSLSNANTAVATFAAPQVTAATTLNFEVTVTDPFGASDTASVAVTVNDVPPPPPPPPPPSSSGGGAMSIGSLLILMLLQLTVSRRRKEYRR